MDTQEYECICKMGYGGAYRGFGSAFYFYKSSKSLVYFYGASLYPLSKMEN